jgi:hypothetical protein
MANWCGRSRSNYFRVKDEAAFRQWAANLNIYLIDEHAKQSLFAVHLGDSTDDGSWPSCDPETGEEIDFVDQLSKHLVKGQIAVLMTAGAENLRYVTGDAVAVNAQGRVIVLSLSAIYSLAARYFRVPESTITRAEY